MSTRQGSSPNPALRTSLPTAFASVVEESSYAHPTQEEQDKYLQARPGATARHLGIALQHAQQIQAQKDAEGMILDQDVQLFKTALQLFRPGDYDNMIMERNYEDLCGYGLCPRKNRKQVGATGSTFHFKYGAKGSGPGGRGRAVDIVPRENLEKWCSDECAERALFIRVQLSEQPVWERRADETEDIRIELLEESRERRQRQKQKQKQKQQLEAGSSKSASAVPQSSESDITAGLRDLKIQEAGRSQELALERGDTGLSLRKGRVDVQLKEKEPSSQSAPTAPQLGPGDEMGGSIEGYIPQEQLEESSNTLKDRDILDQL
ncbi:hypothetical protein N7509_001929 [Penicillium cosmopolitanum]|uniref:RNA polymerase II subunit B1 CTD phosphatase RPAP2 homolog n=1 Tax=Penicillium cosmopolitanum TaxID=1131564 RepID=A0A9X0BCW7_9EURO|nr:uncharacterized protein N7509_001929 [Penicillium cosmopolitanum]KAJ5408046.1 hypothetical protein N7509_001929 [Penicillium cosmopolitanum]